MGVSEGEGVMEDVAPGEREGVGVGVFVGVRVMLGDAPSESDDVGVGVALSVAVPVEDAEPETVATVLFVDDVRAVADPQALAVHMLDSVGEGESERVDAVLIVTIADPDVVADALPLRDKTAVVEDNAVAEGDSVIAPDNVATDTVGGAEDDDEGDVTLDAVVELVAESDGVALFVNTFVAVELVVNERDGMALFVWCAENEAHGEALPVADCVTESLTLVDALREEPAVLEEEEEDVGDPVLLLIAVVVGMEARAVPVADEEALAHALIVAVNGAVLEDSAVDDAVAHTVSAVEADGD